MAGKRSTTPLSVSHPELCKQWHPDRNAGLTPDVVVAGSAKKVWWICEKGPDHEWLGVINNRARGARCPFCTNRYVSVTNSLRSHYPTIADEWHPTKNGDLTPDKVVPGSKINVWWKCESGSDHEWQTAVAHRTRVGSGCPMCSGAALSANNSLATVDELVASQWHPTKNGALTPSMVLAGSHLKAWWTCPVAPDHEWQAVIGTRTGSLNRGCPFCAGKMVSITNSLARKDPKLAREWHPTKNGTLTPTGITFGSNKKTWWVCQKGADHEWRSAVTDRTSGGNGCPFCSGYRASLTNSLKACHPKLVEEWHPTKNGELTPDQFASGSMKRVCWKCRKGPDHEWQVGINARSGQGLTETGCPFCSGYKLSVTNSLAVKAPEIAEQWHPTKNGALTPDRVLGGTTRKAWWKCPKGSDHEWETKIVNRSHVNGGCPYCRGLRVSVTNSLRTRYSDLAKEWHPSKNGDLTPDMVTFGSKVRVWWMCDKGPDHERRADIGGRTRGQGCACCGSKKLSVTNSLVAKYPEIAAQWHSTKNGSLTPDKFFYTSGRKVWWQCPDNPNHEWRTAIPNRTTQNSGCPYCNLRPRSIQEIDLLFELSLFLDIDPEDRKLMEGGRILDCDIIIRKEGLIVEFDGSYWHNSDAMYDRDTTKTEALHRAGWTVIRVREEPLKPTSLCDVPMPFRQDMKLTANDVLLKIQELVGTSIEGINDYVESEGLQNTQASKRFVRRLLREKSTVDRWRYPLKRAHSNIFITITDQHATLRLPIPIPSKYPAPMPSRWGGVSETREAPSSEGASFIFGAGQKKSAFSSF